jgi:uncharacterized protein (TIGR00369 family)
MTAESFSELWARSTGVEFLLAIAQGRMPPAPHALDIGLTIDAVASGRLELSWRPTPRLTNPAGIVHGGYIAMALDDASGLSCASLGERFRPMLTLDLRIDFVRPVRPGETYRAIGEVVHAGNARVLADARMTGPDGRLVARASGSFTPNTAFDPTRTRPPRRDADG